MPAPTNTTIMQRLKAAGLNGYQQAAVAAIFADVNADNAAKFAAIDAWADTLAAKLNLDAGVTDTNYAVLNLPA